MDIYVIGNVFNRGPTDGDYQIPTGRQCKCIAEEPGVYSRYAGYAGTVLDLMLAGF